METAIIVCVIILAAIIACILVLLGILFYNQMLVTNEVNKRLLLLTEDSMEKERSTQAELQEALIDLDRAVNEQNNPKPEEPSSPELDDEPFSPHSISEDYNEQ